MAISTMIGILVSTFVGYAVMAGFTNVVAKRHGWGLNDSPPHQLVAALWPVYWTCRLLAAPFRVGSEIGRWIDERRHPALPPARVVEGDEQG